MCTQVWEKLFRQEILSLEEYPPVEPTDQIAKRLNIAPEQILKLDANECPYGTLPEVTQAIASYPYFHIYPDPHQRNLRNALSQYLNVNMDNIIAGSGIDELLDYMCRMFLSPGDAVVSMPPTFGMYSFDTQLVSGHLLNVPRTDSFDVDLTAIQNSINAWNESNRQYQQRVKLIFVAAPNNPTGNWLSDHELLALLQTDCIVVLDEAYVEFSDFPSRASWVAKYPNLVVFRTFSKVAGMAGLRLGYGIFPDWIAKQLWRFKQPYNVNVAAAVAGISALAHFEKIDKIATLMKQERQRLLALLSEIPFLQPYPSQSNFILCKVVGASALKIKLALEQQGILIRYYSSSGLQDCIRISVGKPEHTERLFTTLMALDY